MGLSRGRLFALAVADFLQRPRRQKMRHRRDRDQDQGPRRRSVVRRGRTPEPPLEPAGSEMGLLRDERLGWLLEGARGLRAAEKVHVNAANMVVAELHIAGASPP